MSIIHDYSTIKRNLDKLQSKPATGPTLKQYADLYVLDEYGNLYMKRDEVPVLNVKLS